MRQRLRLRYLNRAGTWPTGNPRLYFRRPGGKNIPLPDYAMDDPRFLKAYAEALESAKKPDIPVPHAKGTIGRTVVAYLGSAEFAQLGDSTRRVRRHLLEDIRKKYGAAMLRDLLPRHIRKDLAPLDPHPANNRLKAWRGFTKWAVAKGWIDTDPAREVRKPALPRSDGFTAWTEPDVQAFRAHWPVGTPQRLCFELLFRSCAAIGDACKLTRDHVEDGWLTYTRSKSGQLAVVPWEKHLQPPWFGTDDLDACLENHDHLHFMVTAQGKPRSEKAATQWFSKAATAAGLPQLAAHGIRKYRAASFKERGAEPEKRMAILGHNTEGEATRYAKSADLKRVISG